VTVHGLIFMLELATFNVRSSFIQIMLSRSTSGNEIVVWTGAGGGFCNNLPCCCPFPLRDWSCDGEEDDGGEKGRGDSVFACINVGSLVSLRFSPSLTPSPTLRLAPAVLEAGLAEAESLPITECCCWSPAERCDLEEADKSS
jgi:hypothetical protein